MVSRRRILQRWPSVANDAEAGDWDPMADKMDRLDEELERLYSNEALMVMSGESFMQRYDEVLAAIFIWK